MATNPVVSAVFYGSDDYCISDLLLIDQLVLDPSQLVGQRIARRLTTPRGALALISDDPDFGLDVRQYVNAKLSNADISSAQSSIQSEILKDEQVQNVAVSMVVSGGAVNISINGNTAIGPFTLTLNVNQLTASLVFGQ